MKGLELAEKFYNEFGKKMIDENFSHIKEYLAIGLVGSGSECFGFDDEISHDHDFEPGFCLFLPDESIIDEKVNHYFQRLAVMSSRGTFCQSKRGRRSWGRVGVGSGRIPARKARKPMISSGFLCFWRRHPRSSERSRLQSRCPASFINSG